MSEEASRAANRLHSLMTELQMSGWLYCEIFGLDDEGVSKYGKLSAVAIMLRDALVKCADSATDYSGMYVGGLPVDPDCIVDARKALKLAKDIGL